MMNWMHCSSHTYSAVPYVALWQHWDIVKKAGSCVWCLISPSTDLLNSHTCWQGLENSDLRASRLHVACCTRLFIERWTHSTDDSHFSHIWVYIKMSRASEESFWWELCWDIPIMIARVWSWRNRQLGWSAPTHSGGVIWCWKHPIADGVSSSMPVLQVLLDTALLSVIQVQGQHNSAHLPAAPGSVHFYFLIIIC